MHVNIGDKDSGRTEAAAADGGDSSSQGESQQLSLDVDEDTRRRKVCLNVVLLSQAAITITQDGVD